MLIRLEPQDTVFFRESRPMEAQGVKPLGGRFPPPARTVAGAVRTLIGQALDVDWSRYQKDRNRTDLADIDRLIGLPDDAPPGPLRLTGPFPTLDGERVYPVPLHLLRAKSKGGDNAAFDYGWLKPGPAVRCDLGKVQLPVLDTRKRLDGAEPLEACWVKRADFLELLAGRIPPALNPIFTEPPEGDREPSLVVGEPRLGIALDYPRRGAADGQLYQTVHARLARGVGIGVKVEHKDGLPLPDLRGTSVRLGGEGRFAHIVTDDESPSDIMPGKPDGVPKGIVMVLLTPANFHRTKDEPAWLPPGFTVGEKNGATIWTGQIADVELVLVSAVIGKSVREGGWNLKQHAPHDAETLLPPGSVWFCETADPETAITTLTGQKLGEGTALGRGEIAAGYWF